MITVNELKKMIQKFMALEQDEEANSTEWAYVMLEPALLESQEVTLDYLAQIENKEEFMALGENSWFSYILGHFESAEIHNAIEERYARFFGADKDTPFYKEHIEKLAAILKHS